jgi:hypothetical protein
VGNHSAFAEQLPVVARVDDECIIKQPPFRQRIDSRLKPVDIVLDSFPVLPRILAGIHCSPILVVIPGIAVEIAVWGVAALPSFDEDERWLYLSELFGVGQWNAERLRDYIFPAGFGINSVVDRVGETSPDGRGRNQVETLLR